MSCFWFATWLWFIQETTCSIQSFFFDKGFLVVTLLLFPLTGCDLVMRQGVVERKAHLLAPGED